MKSKNKYTNYLSSTKWKYQRKKVMKLKGKRCSKCGSTKKLQLHHKTYRNIFREKDKDLIVLCIKCHKERHNVSS